MPRTRKGFGGSGHSKRVTLQDIADVAGVHAMTVSDALNGTRRVAPATRERIIRIAREMNYVPNLTARALATGKTGRIGLLSGAFDYPYYASMLHYLKQELDQANYKFLLLRNSEEVRDLVQSTNSTEVDGVIAIDMYGFGEEFAEQSSLPSVSIGAYERVASDYVLVDMSRGVEAAVNLMFEAGRRRIAYFVTSKYMAVSEESRARGFIESIGKLGLKPEIINVEVNDSYHAGLRLAAYFEDHGIPDGLLCQNDETAMIAFRTLRDHGMRVPDDVLLVGCDGQMHMTYFDPPLSTIVQPLQETCAMAWRFLQKRIADPLMPQQTAVLRGELVVRASLLAPGSLS